MKSFYTVVNDIVQWEAPLAKLSSAKSYVRSKLSFLIFLSILLLFTLIRIACAMKIPISGDEAYYYLWSRYPSFGYYDHPPMISWIISLFCSEAVHTPLMVRIGPIIAAFISSLILYAFTEELTGNARVALFSGLCILCIPYFAIDSTMTTPNVPLLLFWSLYLFLLFRALTRSSRGYWILSGIALGLALLSKFMAIFLIPSVFLFFSMSRKYRHNLFRLDLYISLLVAFLVFSPFILWNYANHWESFSFQLIERHHFPVSLDWSLFLNFLGLQFLAVTPLFFILFIISIIYMFYKGLFKKCNASLLCFCASAPIFFFFIGVSFCERVEMYWPIAGYLSGSISVILLLKDLNKVKMPAFRVPFVFTLFIASSCLILSTGALYFFALYPQKLIEMSAVTGRQSDEGYKGNSLIEMYAYEDLAALLLKLQQRLDGPEKNFIITDNYSLSSALTYYSGQYIHIYPPWNLQGREYKKWENYPSLKGMDAIYVDRFPVRERGDVLKLLSQNFEEIRLVEPIVMRKYGSVAQIFYVALCRRFNGNLHYELSLPYRGPLEYEKLDVYLR